MTMNKFQFLLIPLFLSLVSVGSAQEKFTLAFSYKAGETYRYKHTYSFDMSQEINGQEMKMSGSSISLLKLVPDSVAPDGSISFISSYEELKTSMKNAMFDTTLEQKDMIGKRGKIVIDKYGKELTKKMIDTLRTEGGFGDAGGAALTSVNFFRLPDHPVSMGEKWVTDNMDTTRIGEGYTVVNAHTEYTLLQKEKKQGHDCLNIAFKSTTETTGKIFQMNMELFVEGTGDVNGAIWFDPVTGILVAKESTMTQDMTYALTGQMKMSIPSTQTIQMNYKLIE